MLTILKVTALTALTVLAMATVVLLSAYTGHEYGPLIGFLCGIGYGTWTGKGLSWLMWRAFPVN